MAAETISVKAVNWQRRVQFLAVLLLGVGLAGAATAEGAGARLRELQSVDQLKAIFDQDSGMPRLVLLLSPT